ncbi:YdcF family protein [Nocardioides sp. CER19]|uniref:YdcF family protein n=1 Tax=Nocardioides sp. CER19 TaxID=3038538 RepID=UPI0024492CD6|nr:YdcF family protein [Nocardioides sp. CER19]MDH2416517.1 YdcF family protein [Nocardioides sp. CER19]
MAVTDLARLDTIAAWLALEDPRPEHVDLMLLFGGSLPPTWEVAAAAVTGGEVGALMLVGGRGHTTDALMAAMGLDGRAAGQLTEADLMARWMREVHGIEDVLLETASTNCGNNVSLAEDVARRHGLRPRTVALVQDPTMQRRMDARFRRAWSLGGAVPVNRPGPDSRRAWPWPRWRGLVMGEVPRLRDDRDGYGPRGRGFVAHVDVPDEVEAAYRALVAAHPEWARDVGP